MGRLNNLHLFRLSKYQSIAVTDILHMNRNRFLREKVFRLGLDK